MRIGYKTHVGKVRKHNEDALLVIKEYYPVFCVFAVADGMGGHNAGEVASTMAIEDLKEIFNSNGSFDEKFIEDEFIKKIIYRINNRIFYKGQENKDFSGMGTTLTSAVCFNNQLHISHIGDSRLYRINANTIEQLTEDHSLVADLVKDGKITKEQAQTHPQKNIITKALGTEMEVEADLYHYMLDANDIILLCTDGLTNMVSEEEIHHIVITEEDLQKAADLLVELANNRGGTDNITLIIFQG